MQTVERLLSFSGRASRLEFWLLCFLALKLALPLMLIVSASIGASGAPFICIPLLIFGAIVICWIGFACAVRRCHDRARSGWFALMPLSFPLSLFMAVELVLGGSTSSAFPTHLLAVGAVLSSLLLVGWYIIELGILGPVAINNPYGGSSPISVLMFGGDNEDTATQEGRVFVQASADLCSVAKGTVDPFADHRARRPTGGNERINGFGRRSR